MSTSKVTITELNEDKEGGAKKYALKSHYWFYYYH